MKNLILAMLLTVICTSAMVEWDKITNDDDYFQK
jgi:hypothetical protein